MMGWWCRAEESCKICCNKVQIDFVWWYCWLHATKQNNTITRHSSLRREYDNISALSSFRVSGINYYLVCSLTIHKIWALCGIFSAISVLLTTENSNDLKIQVPDGSRSLKVTAVNFFMCYFLLVINCTRGRIVYRLWDIAFDRYKIALLLPLLRLTPRGSPWTISVKFCREVRGWLRYTAVKKYCQKLQPFE